MVFKFLKVRKIFEKIFEITSNDYVWLTEQGKIYPSYF